VGGIPKLVVITPDEVAALLTGHGVPSPADRDEMAVPTYMHRNPLARWIFWKRHRVILSLAELGPRDAVLDFGTGIGALLPSLCAAAHTVWATDLRDTLARRLAARRGLNVRFVESQRIAETIGDDTLQVVVAADVLEHIEEPQLSETLRVFAQKLGHDGRLIVSFPTENLLYKVGRILAGFRGKGAYHRTTLATFMAAVSRAGYRVTATRSLPLSGPGRLFAILRLEPLKVATA
jgi:2-polyprenyl-3-methyl-5-hydroxy-6-metoxy-1,4-benzoquinol methylase